jgi:2-dehydro-3-deoxyphosphogluconate aldolase/(4S)-4-hydroxy-2-oxoglutarate aldolase
MVTREDLLRAGAVAIVRMPDQAAGAEVADRIVAAGLTTIEITLTNPGALKIIENLAKRSGVQVGVGTVVNSKDVLRARDAGAQFIVSPNTDEEVIGETKRAGLISLPGVATPSEVAAAKKYGADILKLFPASTFGPGHLKALRDPFPGNFWCPTGGLSADSVGEWFAAGANIVGVGGPLIKGGLDAIESNVKAFLGAVAKARG